MFGTNEVIGKKWFNDAPENSLFVTSIFFTLQGEGPFSGQPAVFIRLTKCNLNCSWCDTFFDDGDWMTFSEIETKIYQTICDFWNTKGQSVPLWALPKKLDGPFDYYPNIVLVITGGEPLLQNNISEFLNRQIKNKTFKAVQIESNGILDTTIPYSVILVCSPKCSEKDGKPVKYLHPSRTILERADCLKFVMSADKNSPYSEIPQWAYEWKEKSGKEIYCSPMNVYNTLPQKIKILHSKDGKISLEQRSTIDETIDFWEKDLLNLEENEKNHKYTARYCMDHGFRLNLQMHLYAGLA